MLHTDIHKICTRNPILSNRLDMFVCLFVCLGKTRKSILRSLCLEGSNNPWEWLHTESGTEIELYPRWSCFQHENRPENTPRPLAWHIVVFLYFPGFLAIINLLLRHHGFITSLQTQGAKYRFSGFTPNKQNKTNKTNKRFDKAIKCFCLETLRKPLRPR